MMLPHRPSFVCPACWEGPFAAQLGLLGEPLSVRWNLNKKTKDDRIGGYTYTTSPAQLLFRAALGCKWCMLLVKHFREMSRESKDAWWPTRRTLSLRIGRTAAAAWILRIVVDGGDMSDRGYAVSAKPGAYTGMFIK